MATVKIANNKLGIQFNQIWSFDPGGTTGFARVRLNHQLKKIYIMELGEFQTWSKLDNLTNLIEGCLDECLVYESFTLRNLAANLIPVEVIGIIRFLCLNKQIYHFAQPPLAQGRLKGQDALVERWYPQLKRFTSHHSSALRHAIFFAIENQTNKELWPIEFDYNLLMQNFLNY